MSARSGYRPGVPCWAAAVHPDPGAAVAFDTELLGWEAADVLPPEGPGRYYVCTLRGRDVAAVGSERGGGLPQAAASGQRAGSVGDEHPQHPRPEGAERFYRSLFGWDGETMDVGGMAVTLWRLPGFEGGEPGQPVPADVVGVMLPTGGDQPSDVPPHWSVDFWVHDADATAATRGARRRPRSARRAGSPSSGLSPGAACRSRAATSGR